MSSVISTAAQKVQDAISNPTDSNEKTADLKKDIVESPTSEDVLSSDFGVKAKSHDISLSVSTEDRKGPQLLEDGFSREKIIKFDHERIPERVVHARGVGAFGHFKLYESASDVTHAAVLTDTSRTTPIFIRFSTVLGSRGSADTVRDVRGFAVKFYTNEGNWDIVGNNIPVFFIQDAMKFPDIIHAAKPEPDTEIPQAQSAHNNFWDFQSLHTEATHMFMWVMSDRAIPRSYRMMQGFGVNTFTLINAAGVRSFVKFHFTPTLGVHSLVWDEALKICGQDPDFHRKDLYTAINRGVFPKWKFGIQVCPESRQDEFDFDILDATKLWSEELLPIRYIGEIELNRNVDEFFTQTEQVAFCTQHLPPGIGFSDDPLLQGRNFSYFDTQLSRVGVNWQELPINRPLCPIFNNHRDGQGRHRIHRGKINYWPNRASILPPASSSNEVYHEYQETVIGMKQRLHSVKFSEHFKQAQSFYKSLSEIEKYHVFLALSFELDHCDDDIVYDNVVHRLSDIDLLLAQAVAVKVGSPRPTRENRSIVGEKMKGLSQMDFTVEALGFAPTISSRTVAIIISDGFDYLHYSSMKNALEAAGAFVSTIGPKRQPIMSWSYDSVIPDHHFEGMRSTLYDSICIPHGKEISSLIEQGRVIHWIREAFGHCKAIGATGEAIKLVEKACSVKGMNFSHSSEVVDSYGVVTVEVVESPGVIGQVVLLVPDGESFIEKFALNVSRHRNFQRELDGLTSMVAY
ncbi:catalase A [Blumeria hordei DH14]|uniref:Catalase n=1 Tax=Blumeria graminis f. sp. hordei (strain DH14) TaxID=546991 RepID=N1J9U8_BLUG1|nr:catalase A [Blumeria hordei DH14]